MKKSMLLLMLCFFASLCMLNGQGNLITRLAFAWETEALFKSPESVTWDPMRHVLFVSNVNCGSIEKKDGYISIISIDGKMIRDKWIDGLNGPKGMFVSGDSLFVSDVNSLVEIDIVKRKVINRYIAKESKFLNDVVVAPNKDVFVSDTLGNAIYRLHNGKFKVWMKSDKLEHPNGLIIERNQLIVATWGKDLDPATWASKVPGRLLSISLKTLKISELGGSFSIGNLDGLEMDNDSGYQATDWGSGTLFNIESNGKVTELLRLKKGSADHEFVTSHNLVVIPMMQDNKVIAYKKNRVPVELGVMRDGSYYTRIEWASHTVGNPLYWVNNLIDNDIARNGGSYGANTMGPANVILSFFGEPKEIGSFKIFHNVGADISPLEELASEINIYVTNDQRGNRFGDNKVKLGQVDWKKIANIKMEKKSQWNVFKLKHPVSARFLRLELVKNFGTPPDKPWTETNEIKIYPPMK